MSSLSVNNLLGIKYLSNSDMKEIDELYTKWWTDNPYELKATQVA